VLAHPVTLLRLCCAPNDPGHAPHGDGGDLRPLLCEPRAATKRDLGQDRDLRRRRVALVAAAVVLSVVVRWEPTLTVVNSTFVARPVRLTWHKVVPLAPSLIAG
jgi:hypothetical protein